MDISWSSISSMFEFRFLEHVAYRVLLVIPQVKGDIIT